MKLELLKKEYTVYKFDPDYKVDINIIQSDDFYSITKTRDELSVVAQNYLFRDFVKQEAGWRILKINEMLDFSLIGILNKISTVLANADISIFAISTYNTDYIMIKNESIKKAVEVLKSNNYVVTE